MKGPGREKERRGEYEAFGIDRACPICHKRRGRVDQKRSILVRRGRRKRESRTPLNLIRFTLEKKGWVEADEKKGLEKKKDKRRRKFLSDRESWKKTRKEKANSMYGKTKTLFFLK